MKLVARDSSARSATERLLDAGMPDTATFTFFTTRSVNTSESRGHYALVLTSFVT